MTGAVIEHQILVKITLASLIDGSTMSISVSNTSRTSSELTGGGYPYPILKAIGEFGASIGNFLPDPISSSITLDNSHGSLGYERRFIDLLDRYTVINQDIKIYVSSGAIDESDDATLVLEWVGTCTNISSSENDLSIEIAGRGIPDRIMNYVFDTNDATIGAVIADTRAYGASVPLVFGEDVQVRPQLYSDADSGVPAFFAYQTTLADDFIGGDISAYYVRDQNGRYRQVYSAASTTTKLWDTLTGTLITVATGNDEAHRTRDLTFSGSDNYIITHAEVEFLKSSGTPTGTFTLEIWSKDPSGRPWVIVGQAQREKADFTWGVANVRVPFVFSNPIPLTSANGYVAYITQTSSDGSSNIQPAYISGASNETSYTKAKTNAVTTNETWTKHVYDQKAFASAFYGCTFTTHAPTSSEISNDGLSFMYFKVTHNSESKFQSPVFLGYPDLSALDFVVTCDGLKDNSGGDITGTPSAVITSPESAAHLMCYDWNGSAWANTLYDDTYLSSTHLETLSGVYARSLSGSLEGTNSRQEVISEICRNAGLRISAKIDTSSETREVGSWCWGGRSATVARISDEDMILDSYEVLGTETIVNSPEMFYSKQFAALDPWGAIANREFSQYSRRINKVYGVDDNIDSLIAVSNTIYGQRRNADREYPLLGSSASAESVAQMLMRVYNQSHHYVSFRVPYYKYKGIGLLEVAEVTSCKFPAFFGTTPSAKNPTYGGDEAEITEGFGLRRARSMRVQIEGRKLIKSDTSPLQIRFIARILNNDKDPT